ncbi:MAG: hypothetical protein ACKVS5_03035 [Parvularculaceae bacterium]
MPRLIFEDTQNIPGVKQMLYGKDVGDLEIFVDGAWGTSLNNGIVKVNFTTTAPTEEAGVLRKEVAVRLAMPADMFLSLESFIRDFREHLEMMRQEREPGSVENPT